ncbi:MAG: response regulator [Gemmatimonadales bacterium]|jgi:CheY-like chemotaxis protein
MAKILVVDDEAQVRSAVSHMLTNLGHEAFDAPDGAEALRLLDAIRFDLVIADVYMPAADGMELLVRIHQRDPRLPVIMISGGGFMSREEVLAMADSSGATATLDKPFTPGELRETLEPLLKSPPAA